MTSLDLINPTEGPTQTERDGIRVRGIEGGFVGRIEGQKGEEKTEKGPNRDNREVEWWEKRGIENRCRRLGCEFLVCVRSGVNSGSRRKDLQSVEFRSIDRKFTGLCIDVGGSSNRSNKSHPVILSLFTSVLLNTIFVCEYVENIQKTPKS